MATPFNLSKPDRPIRCGAILVGGETEILDVAPIDCLHGISKRFVTSFPDEVAPDLFPPEIKAQALDLEFFWVSEKGPSVNSKLTSGISLTPTHSFEDCPPLDIVIMGAHNFMQYQPTEAELEFVRKSYDDSTAFITVCGGIEVPRLAGVLKGKTATSPRFGLEGYRQQSPETNWVEKRWVRDGKLWTSGALLNGLDLMTNFCHEYWGGGEDTLCGTMSRIGAFPNRDVDYKDVSWSI